MHKKYSKIFPDLISFVVCMLLIFKFGLSQDTLKIVDHYINEENKSIQLFIKGIDASGYSFLSSEIDNYKIEETKGSGEITIGQMNVLSRTFQPSVENKEERLIFLLDRRINMSDGQKFEKAKNLINKALKNFSLKEKFTSFSHFADDIARNQSISKDNYETIVEPLTVERNGKNRGDEFFKALELSFKA